MSLQLHPQALPHPLSSRRSSRQSSLNKSDFSLSHEKGEQRSAMEGQQGGSIRPRSLWFCSAPQDFISEVTSLSVADRVSRGSQGRKPHPFLPPTMSFN